MAASVNLSLNGSINFTRRDPYTRFIKAQDGDAYELRRLQRGSLSSSSPGLEFHDLVLDATTDSNTAAGSSNIAINLSTAGLTLASGALASNERRDIFVECLVIDAANSRRYRWVQRTTVGITTSELAIVGRNPQFITSCQANYAMSTADGTATTEYAPGCIPPAWWDGASPVATDISSNNFTISWLGGSAPVGDILPGEVAYRDAAAIAGDSRALQHGAVGVSTGVTSVFISDVASPTAATFANASFVSVGAIVTPPMSAVLGINSTPAPDELILSLVGVAATALVWRVGVTVGDAYRIS